MLQISAHITVKTEIFPLGNTKNILPLENGSVNSGSNKNKPNLINFLRPTLIEKEHHPVKRFSIKKNSELGWSIIPRFQKFNPTPYQSAQLEVLSYPLPVHLSRTLDYLYLESVKLIPIKGLLYKASDNSTNYLIQNLK